MIKQFDKGFEVVELQAKLRYLGLYGGLVTGFAGVTTIDAVKYYQKSVGLAIDGIAGPQTLASINQRAGYAWLYLFIHCTASPEGMHFTAERVKLMHTLPKSQGGRGWSRCGYSDLIQLDGTLENIHDYDQDSLIESNEYTWGTKIMNRNARHFVYVGGTEVDNMNKPKDTRTPAQKKTIETYVKYQLLRNENLLVLGHNQVQIKGCPSFNVVDWGRSIGINEYNLGLFEPNVEKIV